MGKLFQTHCRRKATLKEIRALPLPSRLGAEYSAALYQNLA